MKKVTLKNRIIYTKSDLFIYFYIFLLSKLDEIKNIKRTRAWNWLKRYYKFKNLFKINPKQTKQNYEKLIRRLIEKARYKDIYIIFYQSEYSKFSVQRGIQLSKGFAGLNCLCILVINNLYDRDISYRRISSNLIVIDFTGFIAQLNYFINIIRLNNKNAFFIFENPLIEYFPLIYLIRYYGFKCVYDLVDDWNAFKKENLLDWEYEKDVENFFLTQCDYLVVVSRYLLNKYKKHNPHLISNGFNRDIIPTSSLRILLDKKNKNEIVLGYFGWLDERVFDWNLIIKVARLKPNWRIEIVGYARPVLKNLPDNIKVYGRVVQSKLIKFVKNWNVCLIPFKNNIISKAADPLKYYEYLFFRKPVVATGVSSIKSYPYLFFSSNKESGFINKVIEAQQVAIKDGVVNNFLFDKSWEEIAKKFERLFKK